MNEILNPYIAGAPVVETSMFFGREDVFSWIERSLAGKYVDHILVLHGQRRVGKTSVLKQIPNFLPDKYIQVFFDLQGRTNTTLDRFLWWLAREIARTLKQEKDISLPRPDREAFASEPEYLINEFLPSIKPLLSDHVLLLTFDEFDTLDHPEIRETLAAPLIAYLRQLIEIEWLNFVFSIGSSGDKLENMQASYTDFFKSALYRKISFLTRDDCYRLITKPVEGTIQYDRKAVSRIVEITSGHPYFTQLMCHELFSLCQKTGARRIDVDNVESVLEDVIERGTVNLKFVWDEASDLEKWILAGLAQIESGATTQELGELLHQQRVRFSESDLNSAIIHLRDKDVITQDNQFIIHLMRMWLQANRSMDRVREELVEVNPIANRYIEIGDEYRELGLGTQAIESYQQALRVDPGNLKAQVNIGSVYKEQDAHQEAAKAFERALQIDDEDVVARTGYCDTNLVQGDQARADGEVDQAIQYYHKILIINAAHTDTRQRLSDIHRERAESFLSNNQDEEALSEFSRAIEFTPEDDHLVARYNEVLAGKKAKAIAVWLAKADQALARQRWDEAAEMVSEALRLDPENHDLQAKLLEVKDTPRQIKIQSYKREVEQAITKGDFDKAIDALETAALLAPEDNSLKDWLETTRSGQRDAQLNLYRNLAERTIIAEDWDAAVNALENASQLAPDDSTLLARLEEIKAAKLKAQLDAAQLLSDEALHKQDWNTAIQAVQDAMALAPEETYWREQLAEIKAAQLKSQLDTYRNEARQACTMSNWDATIAALEKYLELDPNDTRVQAEIEAIRREARQQQLADLKSQAEDAASREQWEAAVQAWVGYLDLNPEDKAQAEIRLQNAQKYARIARDYNEAQDAHRKKRYGRAIELLQGIIAQDPTYKSTSQLLVEAVEANKAIPVWRRPWLYATLGSIVVIALGIIFGPRLWQVITTSQEPTPNVEQLLMNESETAQLTMVSAANAFAGPILASIADRTPDFEEDFSTSQDYWYEFYLHEDGEDQVLLSEMISDGILRIVDDEAKRGYDFPRDIIAGENIVLQYDFRSDFSAPDTTVYFIIRGSHTDQHYRFSLQVNGYWKIEEDGPDVDLTNPVIQEGNITLEKDQFYTLKLIAKDDQFTIYLDDEPLAYIEDSNLVGQVNSLGAYVTGDTFNPDPRIKVDIDNIKFWNLDLDSSFRFQVANDFASPILSTIATTPPTFVEDFSAKQDYWDEMAVGPDLLISDLVSDGALRIIDKPIINTSYGLYDSNIFKASDFVLQFDFFPHDYTLGFVLYVEMRAGAEGSYSFNMRDNGNWDIYKNEGGTSTPLILASGSALLEMDQGYTIQVITSGDQFAIFWNDEILAYFKDSTIKGDQNIFSFETALDFQVDFDNIKFWNLDEEVIPVQAFDELWAESGHANAESEAFRHWDEEAAIISVCAKCHSTAGYLDFLGADGSPVGIIDNEPDPLENQGIQCDACHSEAASGKDSVTMPSGVELIGLGDEANCMECHQGRSSLVDLNNAILETAGVENISEVNPDTAYDSLGIVRIHYNAAAATRYGAEAKGGGEYDGKTYTGYFAHVPQFDSCTECHDPHSLEIRVEECAVCHGEAAITGEITKEIEMFRGKLLDEIKNYAADVVGVPFGFNPLSYPYFFIDTNDDGTISTEEATNDNRYTPWTPRLLRASYNLYYTTNEPGAFAHNGKYIVQLLYDTTEDLNPEAVNGLQREYQGTSSTGESKAETIKAYIEATNPTFEDDFSTADMVWGGTSEGLAIFPLVDGGSLTIEDHADGVDLSDEQGVPGLTFPVNKLFNGTNFALQFDFVMDRLDEVGVQFRSDPNQTTFYKVSFYFNGRWSLIQNQDDIYIAGGDYSLDEEANTLLLIVRDQNLAIYLEDSLLYEAEILAFSGSSNRIAVSGEHGSTGRFDNVKFWNLDGVEFSTQASTPTSTLTNELQPYFWPILEYIENQPPTFEDDFSAPKEGWGSNSEGFAVFSFVENGYLQVQDHFDEELTFLPDFKVPGNTFPTTGLFDASDFALQFDFAIMNLDHVTLQFRSQAVRNTGYSLEFYKDSTWKLKQTENEMLLSSGVYVKSDSYNHLLVIVKGSNISVFLNDEWICEKFDLASAGTSNRIIVFSTISGADGRFDNFKFWNLDGVDFNN